MPRWVNSRRAADSGFPRLNFAVWVDMPALWSAIRRFKSAVAPMYSCSGELMLRMM
jgi:hypothetical protein